MRTPWPLSATVQDLEFYAFLGTDRCHIAERTSRRTSHPAIGFHWLFSTPDSILRADIVTAFRRLFPFDRQHVAGFQSHGFSQVPENSREWRLAYVNLIGLMRDEPAADVSENLPSMNELRKAPTRPLNAFETGS